VAWTGLLGQILIDRCGGGWVHVHGLFALAIQDPARGSRKKWLRNYGGAMLEASVRHSMPTS
jgi:hypothetical protein